MRSFDGNISRSIESAEVEVVAVMSESPAHARAHTKIPTFSIRTLVWCELGGWFNSKFDRCEFKEF